MEEQEGKHQSDYHAQFVDWDDLRRFSHLQRLIVAEPGGACRQSGENQENPALRTDRL